jgi:Protein of unknown function, DUF488
VEIYTSHWGSALLPQLDATMLAISRGKPRWKLPYRYRVLGLLAPSCEAFALKDPEEFERAYMAGLEEVGAERIVQELQRIGNGKPAILLCWEKPGELCHRRIFACWFEEQTGVVIPGLVGMIGGDGEPRQRTLF